MAITGAITAAATIGGAVVGNQAKQKAKGQAGQAERDAKAAQDAADATAKQQHEQNINDQSQAGAVARKALGGTLDDTAGGAAAAIAPKAPKSFQPLPPDVHTLLTQPIQRKALIGQ